MTRAQTSHPLDPLSAAEISVAVATVRAAGATPEVANFFIMPLVVVLHYIIFKSLGLRFFGVCILFKMLS